MKITYLSLKEDVPAKGYWDQYLLSELLKDFEETDYPYTNEPIIFIIPGAYQYDIVDKINERIKINCKPTVIITSDEENKFPLEKLEHPNMRLFSTYAYDAPTNVRWLPIGQTPHSKQLEFSKDKKIDVYFSGQANHESRKEMVKKMKDDPNITLRISNGFSQGITPEEYNREMNEAKVVLAPRGNISPDSFRLYEALEKGATPIPENPEFWKKLFTKVPFPVIQNSDQWPGYIQDTLSQYPALNNRCQAWWQQQKEAMKAELTEEHNDLTVVMPVSPIPQHPLTTIFEETYKSIKYHCPKAKIVITFDGIREEQKDKRADYEEHIRKVLWLIQDDIDTVPYIFDTHKHQIGMMRWLLNEKIIKSPLIMYVEQDTPLEKEYIPVKDIKEFILSGQADLVRFSHESEILPDHKHLMIGGPEEGFQKTIQWSQRPHIASTAYYRRIVENHFSKEANCMIEDKMHQVIQSAYYQDGIMGWNQHKLFIFHPHGNIRRSYHIDGRSGEPKFDDKQVF